MDNPGKNMKAKPVLVFILLSALIVGCSNPEKAFQKAKAENTIQSYELFLEKFPESAEANSAMKGIRALRPETGTWTGNDIQFNVSPEGTSLSVQNSKLDNTTSVITTSRTTGYTMNNFIYEEIQIQEDGSFSHIQMDASGGTSGGYIKIEGRFSSPSLASGTFTLKDYGRDQVNGSTDWEASPD